MFGFHTIHNDLDALCPDIVSGCPVNESQTVLLKKVNLPLSLSWLPMNLIFFVL